MNGLRLVRALSIAGGLLLWEWAGRLPSSHLVFPPASAVARALAARGLEAAFWTSLWTTMQALILGFVLIVAAGIPAGLILGRAPVAQRLAEPYLQAMLTVPVAPLVPLFMIAFGSGLAARVATVVVFGLATLVVNTAAGVGLTSASLLRMGASFGAGPRQLLRFVVLPSALPGVMAGLRLASGRAVVGAVVSELVIISVGVGRLINQYSAGFDVASLYAVIVALLAVGLGITRGAAWMERRVVRWR